jgi:hypothetical protein
MAYAPADFQRRVVSALKDRFYPGPAGSINT